MGDVAMLVPVIHSLANQHSDLHVTLLTRKNFEALFDWMPKNVEVIGVNPKDYAGITGLTRLYRELRARKFDCMADMHDVLRSKYLRTRFRLSGVKCAKIDKGRKEKKKLLGHGNGHQPLKPMVNRYVEVLETLGLDVTLDFNCLFNKSMESLASVEAIVGDKQVGERWVGIAPFAAHDNKIYPLDKMRQMLNSLSESGCRVFLFGAGKKEKELLEGWESDHVESICGKMESLHDEILLMSMLDVMVAMDSANMHIASLVGVPVISVWGPTHPKAGFIPWNQPSENIIQVDDLPCRPCSVYGNKPCRFDDLRCMNRISPETIINKVKQITG